MNDCPPFGVYSFKNVALTIDSAMVVSFAEGDDAIMISPVKQIGNAVVGADGGSIVSISASQAATMTLKLLANSPMNAYLRNKVKLMRAGGLNITMNVGFADMSLGDMGGCTSAVITKEPDIARGENASEQEWEIFCPCWQPSAVVVTRT